MKLHIGGRERRAGWTILDAEERPEVDVVGSCADLSAFAGASVEQIYVSHVLEHVSHQRPMYDAPREWFRVLVPGGLLLVSVPDLGTLAALFVDPRSSLDDRWRLMRMIFGGQDRPFDFHQAGFDEPMLRAHLARTGFEVLERVASFGLFDDASEGRISPGDNPAFPTAAYSLNLVARKPAAPGG